MRTITPHIWFDTQAEEAANFYVSLFKNSKLGEVSRYTEAGHDIHNMPAGSVLTATFELDGQTFMALNGGPAFQPNPSISFTMTIKDEEELDRLFAALSENGSILMPLQKYDFSDKYAWVQDRFGVSWQLTLSDKEQPIFPSLMFVGDVFGKAEEAINFYTSVFPGSNIEMIAPYGPDNPSAEGKVAYASFTLCGQPFSAMESNLEHEFNFNEAISLMVYCKDQQEIDAYWDKLSADPTAEQCGWLKDKYGVSWQIVPTVLDDMMNDADAETANRVMEAVLQMKKLEIEELKRAYAQ